MKNMKYLAVLLIFTGFFPACAQEEPIRLIIRSDDMGFSHSANEAIIDTYENGITTVVEIMAPTPWFPEAVAMLKEHPDLDVGIHLALTSEWSNMKWRPLTRAPSLTDDSGYFFPMIWPNDRYGAEQALRGHDWSLEEIENEFRAQIELAVQALPQISHLTGHMGCSNMSPEVNEIYRKLAAEFNLAIFPEDMNIGRARYEGEINSPADKRAGFIGMLKSLESGTWLFVDHPAYDTPEVRAIHHTGYSNVAEDRQAVTDLLKDPEIKNLINKRKIELIDYRDLVE